MSDTTRLIGDDATICKVTFGTEKTGDATKTLDELAGGAVGSGDGEGFWQITAKAATGSIFGSLAVGDLFPADGDEILIVGDKAKFATLSVFLDASSWNASFSAAEIDTSLLVDKVKKYRKGKGDGEGSIKGIFTTGVTDQAGGLLNQFLRIVSKSSAGVITVSEIDSSPIYIFAVVRNSALSGEMYEMMYAQINLFGIKLGGESGNKQEYESKFRFTGNDPCYYIKENT